MEDGSLRLRRDQGSDVLEDECELLRIYVLHHNVLLTPNFFFKRFSGLRYGKDENQNR